MRTRPRRRRRRSGRARKRRRLKVTCTVRKIVAEVGRAVAVRVDRDGLAAAHDPDVIPDDLGVTEARPSVSTRLGDKGVPAPPTRGDEERQPRDAIVEGDLRVAALGRQEARRGPVAAVLGPVGVVTCPDMGPECVSRR